MFYYFYVILKNLVENGLKYNENELFMIIVCQVLKIEQFCLLVIDNGIGILDEFKFKVFDMFYWLYGWFQYEGIGFGLVIVQWFVGSFGVSIEISDCLGGGIIFFIEFMN